MEGVEGTCDGPVEHPAAHGGSIAEDAHRCETEPRYLLTYKKKERNPGDLYV
jgi:hypothetical protein